MILLTLVNWISANAAPYVSPVAVGFLSPSMLKDYIQLSKKLNPTK